MSKKPDFLCIICIIMFIFIVFSTSLRADPDPPDPLTSSGIVSQVLSVTNDKHIYDFRQGIFEISLGYGQVREFNNFENDTFELQMGIPFGGFGIGRFNLRRSMVRATEASRNLGRTPFKQEAQSSRYELGLAYDLSLIEGRGMSRLSPYLPDLETVTYAVGGAHYNWLSPSNNPFGADKSQPLAGQTAVNPSFVFELGIRWTVYLPQSLGVYTEILYERAMVGSRADLTSWSYLSGGLLWSFGKS